MAEVKEGAYLVKLEVGGIGRLTLPSLELHTTTQEQTLTMANRQKAMSPRKVRKLLMLKLCQGYTIVPGGSGKRSLH